MASLQGIPNRFTLHSHTRTRFTPCSAGKVDTTNVKPPEVPDRFYGWTIVAKRIRG